MGHGAPRRSWPALPIVRRRGRPRRGCCGLVVGDSRQQGYSGDGPSAHQCQHRAADRFRQRRPRDDDPGKIGINCRACCCARLRIGVFFGVFEGSTGNHNPPVRGSSPRDARENWQSVAVTKCSSLEPPIWWLPRKTLLICGRETLVDDRRADRIAERIDRRAEAVQQPVDRENQPDQLQGQPHRV